MCKSQHNQFLSICIVFGSSPSSSPALTPGFSRVVNFIEISISISILGNEIWLFVTLVGFLFLVSLAIFPLITKKMWVKIFRKRDISFMWINYVTLYMKTIGTSPLNTPWKYQKIRAEAYSRNRPQNSLT